MIRPRCLAMHGQVILVGQSQGGHVAAMMACMVRVDAVVLLSSVPDEPEIQMLRGQGTPVCTGGKVR